MNCPKDKTEMEIFSSKEGNGWKCPKCGYIHWDIASCEMREGAWEEKGEENI